MSAVSRSGIMLGEAKGETWRRTKSRTGLKMFVKVRLDNKSQKYELEQSDDEV